MNPQPKIKTVRDAKYLAFLRTLPCAICSTPPPSQSHHSETGGISLVGSDHSAYPVCLPCHRDIHQKMSKRGPFKEDELNALLDRLLAAYKTTS